MPHVVSIGASLGVVATAVARQKLGDVHTRLALGTMKLPLFLFSLLLRLGKLQMNLAVPGRGAEPNPPAWPSSVRVFDPTEKDIGQAFLHYPIGNMLA